MIRFISIFIIILSAQAVKAQDTHLLDSTTLTSRLVKDGLDIPWEIIWGPDDHIWCTERYGRVSRIDPMTGQQSVLLDLSGEVFEQSEAGMLGMVLHPDFANNPHVFIAYTYLEGNSILERLVRFEYTGTSLMAVDTLVENIVGNTTHIGCRLIILPDNTMLMSTGDAQNQSLPQNENSVVGKILRMNLDGTIPTDNPNPESLVWSTGHRNAQGIWLAPNGILYSSEHGPTTDDELNILKPNKNYGWPVVAGYCDTPPENAFCEENNVEEPLVAYTPTIAPSDIIWYDHPSIPEFQDKLLMTVLKDRSLIVYTFNEAGDSIITEHKYLKNDFGRLRDVCIAPSGKLYLATNGNSWANNNPFSHSIMELSNEAYVATFATDLEQPEFQVTVFPNPIAQGQTLTIKLAQSQQSNFELYNTTGQLVINEQITGDTKLDLDVEAGIYYYRFVSEDGMMKSESLVVE